MNFAVVKFLEETSDAGEMVSEIPSSWLTQNNAFCKWPPEKYVTVYINKSYPPQDEWKEYPVIVECFCATLKEAKERTMTGEKTAGKVGRGFRKIKPREYFSPAEEDDRMKALQKKMVFSDLGDEEFAHGEFMKSILNEQGSENRNPTDIAKTTNPDKKICDEHDQLELDAEEKVPSENSSEKDVPRQDEAQEAARIIDDLSNNEESDNISGAGAVAVVTDTIFSESDVSKIEKRLDTAISFLCELKIDIEDIKQRLTEMGTFSVPSITKPAAIPFELPLSTLEDLERLETYVKADDEGSNNFIKYLKVIGGNDSKDFTIRIFKKVLTNSLAELCSWTGRKGNFEIGTLKIVALMFDTVHQKYKNTYKEFECTVMEWLRHAKQSRLRERN